MKIKSLLQSFALFVPLGLLTGCVGYNTALFMTKSNVGLDLDTKPPTAEINVSRKEIVIEPSFEGGKTPPVLASFSTRSGNNGVSSFFQGVNQVFAGGDTAVTMAKLYDTKTNLADFGAEGATNKARFNSGLQLVSTPNLNKKKGWLSWKRFLFGMPETNAVRPFVFGTDTQFGLKVAWSGMGGPYPDTIKVGFNRKEMALAPITISSSNEVRIPSFLATVEQGSSGETNGLTNSLGMKLDVAWMQYFATGEAADYLARQYGVRKAMLERADPKASVRSEKEKAGEDQQKEAVNQAAGMTKWATKDGKLDSESIQKLTKGTDLEKQNDGIANMAPADFQKKLSAGSWSIYVPDLWKNYPNKPQD